MTKVTVSKVINLPINKVWERIRPFDSLYDWHTYVKTCTMENNLPDDKIGGVRKIELVDDGGYVYETLLALSDVEKSITYDIIKSPMPVTNYLSKIDLHEVTEGNRTFVNWSTDFETDKENEAEMIDTLTDIYLKGLVDLVNG